MRSAQAVLLLSAALAGCAADGVQASTPMVAAPVIAVDNAADEGNAKRLHIDDEVVQRCMTFDSKVRTGDCRAGNPKACATACKRGETAACARFGDLLHDNGADWCAKKLYELACNNGSPRGCVGLAEALGDTKRAEQLLDKTCEGGFGHACTERGELYENQPDALKMFELGCSKGHVRGCKRAAVEYESGPQRDRSKRALQLGNGCELGDADSCIALARALMSGAGVAKDAPRGQQLLQRVCAADGSDGGEACHLLAQVLATSRGNAGISAIEIAKLFGRACNQGQFDACTQVATEHYTNARYAQAVAASDKLVAKNARHWLPRYTRGMSLFDLGRFAAATKDLKVLTELRSEWHYAHLWHYVAVGRSGGAAKAELKRASKALGLDAWPGPVVSFYLGGTSAAQLLRKANNPDGQKQLEQLCEAHFYIAQSHMIQGRHKAAARLFKKTVDSGLTNFVEFASAKAELARLSP
jgi:TPR repeat protein